MWHIQGWLLNFGMWHIEGWLLSSQNNFIVCPILVH